MAHAMTGLSSLVSGCPYSCQAADIREAVTEMAEAFIEEKGSFSLAVPGGSVVAALGGLEEGAFDFSKTHIFFCNEKIPSFPCYEGALTETNKLGIPVEQVCIS